MNKPPIDERDPNDGAYMLWTTCGLLLLVMVVAGAVVYLVK